MTIRDLFTLYNGIIQCDDIINPNGNFSLKLALAFHQIEGVVKAVEKSRPKKPTDLIEYERLLQELNIKYIVVKDGEIVMNGSDMAVSDPVKYFAERKELEARYESVVTDYNNSIEEWSNVFDKDVKEHLSINLELPTIKRNEFPKDIKVSQLRGIAVILQKEDN